ncbi:MAG: hypothetical protein A2504_13160 [Bdellovibrionales bacterium RIFOXYD12_FULL_39_22]|nr:MAG: hypothetical protein A2385_00960 [Bdellovibrionales bacterium RIFOXYB1_FULL_39_21]OFZ43576.1 MAG: hypothetical protein A2485_12630 [Bdellovibrionales bacterium RIFOXYC12_FULL_39_17]OFZ44595.1 MAG: hypothetical protein A2404_10320 [Bdellovibrionales bacterium RIFOXYC1_FULL_39_130]OFZ76354.1 MAG: hypothetical protein A2560_06940 [Bdellovibrionales bacterium RIFOXYD1_FULL_39_84]OFZ94620.1 MAG: hypothetical protein A2504_13160 [Bdellovibrionales bacterium RIFOXYD12_FULL_39_22]HLE12925.1 bi
MAIKLDNDNQDGIMADINMTPLIDIMLVLLIIFMVTSSISLESGLDIDLPKTKVKTSAKDGNAVIVSLSVNGTISVQGKAATMESLGDTIKEALANEKSDVVVFEGDKTSQLGMAIQIMDIAKEAGAEKFAIAAEQASP